MVHKAGRHGEGWPGSQEPQREGGVGERKGIGHGAVFGLDILEIRQAFEVGAQWRDGERAGKALPAKGLRLFGPVQRLQRGEAGVLPLIGRVCVQRSGVKRLQRLGGAVSG